MRSGEFRRLSSQASRGDICHDIVRAAEAKEACHEHHCKTWAYDLKQARACMLSPHAWAEAHDLYECLADAAFGHSEMS